MVYFYEPGSVRWKRLQKANGGFVKNAQEYNSGKSNNIKWLYWFL